MLDPSIRADRSACMYSQPKYVYRTLPTFRGDFQVCGRAAVVRLALSGGRDGDQLAVGAAPAVPLRQLWRPARAVGGGRVLRLAPVKAHLAPVGQVRSHAGRIVYGSSCGRSPAQSQSRSHTISRSLRI